MDRSRRSSTRQLIYLVVALLLVTSPSGCVRRRMTVRSNPPGAVVYVDQQRIGVTPVSTGFTYYGTRNVQVVRDGCEAVTEKHHFATPWYEYPVIDFFSENLWPLEIRDERVLDFELPPLQTVPPTQVMQRANQLRNEAQRGMVTPLVEPKHPALRQHSWLSSLMGGQAAPSGPSPIDQ